MGAHRIMWEMDNGPIPDGMVVCHQCDNPSCVRPEHLFLGSSVENTADRHKKGRSAKGIHAGAAKLTDGNVRDIRSLHATGRYSYSKLGTMFGVKSGAIGKIICRKSWRHVE